MTRNSIPRQWPQRQRQQLLIQPVLKRKGSEKNTHTQAKSKSNTNATKIKLNGQHSNEWTQPNTIHNF